ncbi:unnamed protein product [Paramecium pentaurelia]|uniref:Uncharacterized protein n=1 Tax=Paramecium pentaurelia TaxID=43138 RepID=A0A8S1SC20_9CILI|nr:unnamed protein product [Paramecium pentaurelia]
MSNNQGRQGNDDNQDSQININNQGSRTNDNTQMQNQKVKTQKDSQKLKDIYDVDTRYIVYPLGPYEDQDVQCYVFNIFNQYLKQNLSFCETDIALKGYKQRYFAKLQPEVDIILVPKIIENILLPIREHINQFTEKDKNLDNLYDETMALIKQLNAIKID